MRRARVIPINTKAHIVTIALMLQNEPDGVLALRYLKRIEKKLCLSPTVCEMIWKRAEAMAYPDTPDPYKFK